ncbi:hypothetical protein [Faecalibacterium duncaniae]|uniref:hypothetical protein n=1 Tax=Faecalibacterium duncaniae (strain DSM 17677 / JCM 31915 / A2-165) TaxID=411483 RepID=UPI002940E930|nr:hypothetical protein [Faecalibacterium duncaniae]MDV5048486.1 hypothetical protein [Faecalibacterium duncaniae]
MAQKRGRSSSSAAAFFHAKLLKRRNVYLKLTRHNGRAGAHGTYNPKHNDRSFNLANSEHIDPERAKGNIYWDCFHGFRSALDPQDPDDLAATFSDVERQFYETHYTAFIESQNGRNAKIRHTERNRSIPDLLSSRKTCPEETIYQLGTLDEHASAEDLLNIVTEFIDEFKSKYGDYVHVLDWALHLDESTPHIHERHVFDCENKYGEVAPQQEKALEALGFELPDPDKPLSRRNNRKITFDAACRKMLFEIAKRHGLELEEEAEYGNRKYLEKQDFILAKQKEQLAAQQNKLDELTLKVNDMETLIDEVLAAAYGQGGGGRDGRSAHRDPERRYADDRGHEEVGAVPGEKGSAGHERVCSAPFGHRAGQVPQDHADHRHSFAGETPEAGGSAERQRTGQGESTGFRSATAESLADRTGTKQTSGTTPHTGGALGNLNSSGTFGAESWHFLPRHPVTRKRRSAYEYESA